MKTIDLHNNKKIQSGFKTPEGYFDSFEERIVQHITFEENKIETGFTTPSNYFDSFEEKIMQQLSVETKEVKIISLWQRQSFWLSSVAAVVIVSIGTLFLYNQQTPENTVTSTDYLVYQNDITTEDIAMHLTDEDIVALETEINTFDQETENYINAYLN